MLVHDDDVGLPGFYLTPELCQYVIIAAVRVAPHDHSLIETRHIPESFLLVLRLERLREVQGFHLDENVDAPAVGEPVREVRVIVGRYGPDDRPVTHLSAPGLLAVLVRLHHQAVDLVEGLQDARVDSAVHFIIPLAEELVAGTDELRIRRLVDFPLAELVLCLLVEPLHSSEISVPVPLCTGLILDELDAGLDILDRIVDDRFVLVAYREGKVEGRKILEPP